MLSPVGSACLCLVVSHLTPNLDFSFRSHLMLLHRHWMRVAPIPQASVPRPGDSQSCRNLS